MPRKTRLILAAVALAAVPALAAGQPASAALGSVVSRSSTVLGRQLAPGVTMRAFTLWDSSGTVRGHTVFIDTHNTNLQLRVVAAHDQVAGGGETVSSMANRSGAVVAVNAAFFRIWSDDSPIGEEVVNGQLLQSALPSGPGYSTIGIGPGNQVNFEQASFSGSLTDGTASTPLLGVNTIDDDLSPAIESPDSVVSSEPIIITGTLGRSVTYTSATVAAMTPVTGGFRVTSVHAAGTVSPPTGTDRLLVGSGTAGSWISAHVHVNDVVTMGWSLGATDGQPYVTGAGEPLLVNGQDVMPSGDLNVSEAKSAIGMSRHGRWIVLINLDGGTPGYTIGMDRYQIASWLAAQGVWTATLFDDGGSAEMVALINGNRVILNRPSDGYERPVADALVLN